MYAKWNNYISETSLIPNCKVYDFTLSNAFSTDYAVYYSSPKCVKCNEGYLETNSQTSCHQITSALSYCLLVDSVSGNCIECSKNYLPISGACQPNPIEFCEVAEYNTTLSEVHCTVCNDGYYFFKTNSLTSCLPGKVNNCKKYLLPSADTCSECEDGYALFQGFGGKSKCLEISHTNCLDLNVSTGKIQSNSFSCLKCKSGFYKCKHLI